MGIVLLEAPNPGQAMKGAAVLIAMQDTEVRPSDRELTIGPRARGKQQAVACTWLSGCIRKHRYGDIQHLLLCEAGSGLHKAVRMHQFDIGISHS